MFIYTVKKGDTLSEIASKYRINQINIITDNNLKAPYTLLVGQCLIIDIDKLDYIVQNGDTFDVLSNQYNISISKIKKTNNINNLKKGQRITSIRKLSERWNWSVNKTYRYLHLLEDLGMITRESDNRRTLITIVKYEVFQDTQNTDEYTDRTLTNTLIEHSRNTNKNEKNEKNEKKYYKDENLNQSFLDYIKMRKDIKKPMSDRAITLAMNKLEELSGGDDETAIQILEQSIFHSWQGLFELKNEPKKVPQYKQFAHRDDGLTDLERELISN